MVSKKVWPCYAFPEEEAEPPIPGFLINNKEKGSLWAAAAIGCRQTLLHREQHL